MSETAAGAKEAPLEDLMVAMDVVDTIRHRRLIVARELDAEGRRERLIERLREIYTAQGIEVTDAALEAGVDALEKERFAYTPAEAGLSRTLAKLYVRRDRWLKPLLFVVALGALLAAGWYYSVVAPRDRLEAALPGRIETVHASIITVSDSEAADRRANELAAEARRAASAGNVAAAESVIRDLERLLRELESSYEIRVVSRPNELSGVWRVPDANVGARNYYLIVEAVDAGGNVVRRRLRNEETGRMVDVGKWGLRVEQDVFDAVAADKRDDGIIQDFVVGNKVPGKLEPDYRVPTTGASITEW